MLIQNLPDFFFNNWLHPTVQKCKRKKFVKFVRKFTYKMTNFEYLISKGWMEISYTNKQKDSKKIIHWFLGTVGIFLNALLKVSWKKF